MRTNRPLRVIQWATGSVGHYAIGAIAEDPSLELAGVWVHDRVPQALFYRICYALLFVTGLKLLYDGVAGL